MDNNECTLYQVVDDEGKEVENYEEGNLAVKVKPYRPVGLFTHYVVSVVYW